MIDHAVDDCHQQALKALQGLTALEVLNGGITDNRQFSDKIGEAAMKRMPVLVANDAPGIPG